MIVWAIILGIIAAFVGLIIYTAKKEDQSDDDIASTATWLEAEAIIQSAANERLDKYTYFPSFSFSYSVNGLYYSGKFFLKAYGNEAGNLIQNQINQKIPVQYNPDNPSAWYIAEKNIEAFEILQPLDASFPSDYGPYRSIEDGPIDLNLNR